MKYFSTIILTFLFSLSFTAHDLEKIMSQLNYARFCIDSLHDSDRAIAGYDKLLVSLENSDLDSLRLIAEGERIELLNRTGERTELLASLGRTIELAQALDNNIALAHLLNLRGFVYTQLGFLNKAQDVLEIAHARALKITDNDARNLVLGYYSAIQSFTSEKSDLRIAGLTKSYQYFMKIGPDSPSYRSAQITGNSYYASAFIENDKLDSAVYYLTRSTSFIDPNDPLSDDYYAILNFAKLHYLREDYTSAKQWFEQALTHAQQENNKYRQGIIYYHLFNTEFAMGESKRANQYLQRYASLKEDLDNIQMRSIRLVEEELTNQRQNIIDEDSAKETGVVAIFTVIAFLSCVSIVWVYIKKRAQSTSTPSGSQNTLTFLGHPEKQGTTDTQSPSGVILNKGTATEESKPQRDESYNETPEVSVEKIKELNQLVKANDPSFMVKFHEAYPGFARTLSSYAYPALNNFEIEVCACTKLNFSTKEIALYRHYTLRSVENRKYRIRKKLTLGSEVDFVVWIAGVS